jgi:hypothetical protein
MHYKPDNNRYVNIFNYAKVRKLLFKFIIISFLFLISGFLFINYTRTIVLLLFFIICFISMSPLKAMPWFGFFDMNIILTVYSSVTYGIGAGIFIANASALGLLFFNPDINIIIDIILSYIIAITIPVFIFLPISTIIISCALVYVVLGSIIHTICGTMDWENICWYITNFLWIWLVVSKILIYFV